MKYFLTLLLVFSMVVLVADYIDNLGFGKRMFNDKLYEEAILEFEKVVAAVPTSPEAEEALFLIGESYREKNQPALAEESYRRLWEGYPSSLLRDKALYYYALVLHQQRKYQDSSTYFAQLVKNYPKSRFTGMALYDYMDSLFRTGNYNEVVATGSELKARYKDNPEIATVMLVMARAYYQIKMDESGDAALEAITLNYPDTEARWMALELKLERKESRNGISAVATILRKELSGEIPRKFKERFKLKLAKYDIALKNYQQAADALYAMLERYDHSDSLDEYLSLYTYCLLQLKGYKQVLAIERNYKKVFARSHFSNTQIYYYARAKYYLQNYDDAVTQIRELLENTTSDTLEFKALILDADILNAQDKLTAAIKRYLEVTARFTQFGENPGLLTGIGDIYYHRFRNYPVAYKYYLQVVISYSSSDYYAEATYKSVLCLEQMQRYSEAVDELEQIRISTAVPDSLLVKIRAKLEYLKQFKAHNSEVAIASLIEAIEKFSRSSNKAALRISMVDIVAFELKDIEKALTMLGSPAGEEELYLKARLLIRQAEKFRLEQRNEKVQETLAGSRSIAARLTSPKKDELILRIDWLHNPDKKQVVSEIEKFLLVNSTEVSAAWFHLTSGRYYRQKNKMDDAARHWRAIRRNERIDRSDYIDAKLQLAEYEFSQGNWSEALFAYNEAEERLSIAQPELFYHYALCLSKTGKQDEALRKITFLLNNTASFNGHQQAVKETALAFIAEKDYAQALKYYSLTPEVKRDDAYYGLLTQIYTGLNDWENTKKTLMYIQAKTIADLTQLGTLQFETGDLHAARYTFEELMKKDSTNKMKYQVYLGDIAFKLEDFKSAISRYKAVTQRIASGKSVPGDKLQIAINTIISYYKIQNRPKAESTRKQFKSLLKGRDTVNAELNLYEAIYYIDYDKAKAEKLLTKLLKNSAASAKVKEQTRFWRGVARMKLKKSKEAEEDFQAVVRASNRDLRLQAHLKLGTLKFSAEEYQISLDNYYVVIQQDSTGKLALDAARNFAFVCKTIEEWEKAINAYELILHRWGDRELQADTIFDIAFCYYRDKNYPKAVEMFQRALPLLSTDELKAEAQYWQGESYFGMEDWEQAITALLKVSYSSGHVPRWAPTAEIKSADAYLRQGRREKAISRLQRVIDHYGTGSEWGRAAKEKMSKLY
ncbi:MAG: tetratricopeptide repeat protein [Candidatus Cloacimonetes bacterium]|nr:tetratricopeptide repeat protein [Candidatus Cloacimonadota bacterium]